MASVVLRAAGSAIAGPIGGAIGGVVGGFLDSFIFGRGGREGPRLESLAVQSSTYGRPIARTWGRVALAGNVIWARPLEEVRNEDRLGGKGSPGASRVGFEYFGSFAVAVTEGPVDAVLRIWADNKLIADLSAESAGEGRSFKYGAGTVRIYPGDETQLPDPLMEADAGSAPAYRGICYLVFERLPLADFGNRVPNIAAEVVRPARAAVLEESEVLQTGAGGFGVDLARGISPFGFVFADPGARGYAFAYASQDLELLCFDRRTRETLWHLNGVLAANDELRSLAPGGPAPVALSFGQPIPDPATGGFWLGVLFPNTASYLAEFDRNGNWTGVAGVIDAGAPNIATAPQGLVLPLDETGSERLVIASQHVPTALMRTWSFRVAGSTFLLLDSMSHGFNSNRYALDHEGRRVWLLLFGQFSDQAWVTAVDGGGTFGPVLDLRVDLGLDYDFAGDIAYDSVTDRVVLVLSGTDQLALLDPGALSVEHRAHPGADISREALPATVHGSVVLPDSPRSFLRYDLVRKSVSARYDLTQDFPAGLGAVADLHADAIWGNGHPGDVVVFLGRQRGEPTLLRDIVEAISARAGLGPGEVDATELDDEVPGYIVAGPMSARDMLEPLRAAFYFDAVERDGKLVFRKRGRAAELTIPWDHLGAGPPRERERRFGLRRIQDDELPVEVALTYLGGDYEPATVRDQRQQLATVSRRTIAREVPMVLAEATARRAVATALLAAWTERVAFEFSLGPRYASLEATSVVDVATPRGTVTLRLERIEREGGGALRCRGVRHHAGDYAPDLTVSPTMPEIRELIPFIADTQVFFWNGPVVSPARDDDGGFFLAVAPRGGGSSWSGALVLRADTPEAESFAWQTQSQSVSWLVTETRLPDLDLQAAWNVFDRSGELVLRLQGPGELSSASPLAVLNGANALVIGQEVVQFLEAELIAPRRYRLRGLLRGRLGTETRARGHAARAEGFVLDRARLLRVSGLEEVGLERVYRVVTLGAGEEAGRPERFTNLGAALRPWAPVHVRAVALAGGDLVISWQRRTRFGGGWRDGTGDVPVGEAEERYEVEIRVAADGDLRRSASVTGAREFQYVRADQLADFPGGVLPPLEITVHQMSAAVGRGEPGRGYVP